MLKSNREQELTTITVFAGLLAAIVSFGSTINSAYSDVVNSFELEQTISQIVNCLNVLSCSSSASQSQTGNPLILLLFNNLDDVKNSAEIEQVINQELDCENAIACDNSANQDQQDALTAIVNIFTQQDDVTNSAEIEQSIKQDTDCQDTVCFNRADQQQVSPTAAVVNVLSNLEDVENSAEIEQVTKQDNDCESAACPNNILSKLQDHPTAAVINVLTDQEDVKNSAEIEQVTKQEDDCEISACNNIVFSQQQDHPTAAVVNVLSSLENVENSAEVEQEIKQENKGCEKSQQCTNTVFDQTQLDSTALVINILTEQQEVENSAEIEQKAEQENEDCKASNCVNEAAQFQTATAVAINEGGKYQDVSNSAKVEQKIDQENEDCEASNCSNSLPQTQTGSIEIDNNGNYFEDISNSAEIEQNGKQENRCEGEFLPECLNSIRTQTQTASISAATGQDNDKYKDIENSAEIEQKTAQENSCELSDDLAECVNRIGANRQTQSATISTDMGYNGWYEDISTSSEVEQEAQQHNDCEQSGTSSCNALNLIQSQTATMDTTIGNGDGSYEDISTSAEIEQEIQEHNDCELSDQSECRNRIDVQTQEASINTDIGNGDGSYEDISTSAEIEQSTEQHNDCKASEGAQGCINTRSNQIQSATISTDIGNGDGSYEDISTSAEIEQSTENKNDCEITELGICVGGFNGNSIQTATISTDIGNGDGSYEDISTSAEIEQSTDQENKCVLEDAFCRDVINSPSQSATISTDIGNGDGNYDAVSSDSRVEQESQQKNECEISGDEAGCTNDLAQTQTAFIDNSIGNSHGNYEDISTSAEIEQQANQQNNCKLSGDFSVCRNNIGNSETEGSGQDQKATITNTMGGDDGNYEHVSNSAEIEQAGDQENDGCDETDAFSACQNAILNQGQTATIANTMGGDDGNYEHVSNSAEIEQAGDQENNDCNKEDSDSDCMNTIILQQQTATVTNTVGGSNVNYEDVENSAEIEQVAQQENEECSNAICHNFVSAQVQDANTDITITGNEYGDVSNSAEVEQIAEQKNKDCKGDGACTNEINFVQLQKADVVINNDADGTAYFEGLSNSVEVEQLIKQENENCQISTCVNSIASGVPQEQDVSVTISNIGSYEEVSNSAKVEQTALQENKDCKNIECVNALGAQVQEANIDITNTGNVYSGVSNSAEIEQITEQKNNDCEDSNCDNFRAQPELQKASITISNSGDGGYKDIVTSAEIEQVGQQVNNGCASSNCKNLIEAQEQQASISISSDNVVYYDNSKYSAEIEQVAEQENRDCDNSTCDNLLIQAQDVNVDLTGENGGDSYSTEAEQKARQENNRCEDSDCFNSLGQSQTVDISSGSSGSGSYYVKQEAVQKNILCSDSTCTNNLDQTQTVSGSGSASEIQKSEQYNLGCFHESTCTNENTQTGPGTSKQYNIGCINSTCVNPGGAADVKQYNIGCINTILCQTQSGSNQYNVGCIDNICAYQGDLSSHSSSFSTLRASTSYKAVAETQTLKTSDATKIEAVTAANSQSGTPQSTPLTISDYSEIEGHVTTSSNDDNIDDTDDQTDDDTDDQTDDDTDDQTDDDTDDQTDDDTDDQTDDDNNDDSNVEGGDDGDESGD
jgi:hypothetical protein